MIHESPNIPFGAGVDSTRGSSSNTPRKTSEALEDQMSFNVDLCDIDVDGSWVSWPNRLK